MEHVDAGKISIGERLFDGFLALTLPGMLLTLFYPANLAAITFRWVAITVFGCMTIFGIYVLGRRAITGRAW
jgi:hypothetical protein